MKIQRLIVGLTVLLAGLAGTASAALIAYEGFDYTAAQTVGGLSGGTGWTTVWKGDPALSTDTISGGTLDITTPGSTNTGLQVAGNAATVMPTSALVRAYRSFPSVNSGTVYFSMLATRLNSGTRFLGIQLFGGETAYPFFGMNSGQTNWSMSGPGTTYASGTLAATNVATLLVLRVDFNVLGTGSTNERVRLYVNPTPGALEPATAAADSVATTTYNIPQLDRLGIGAGYTNATDSTSIGTLDEVRIGTTWADVAPAPVDFSSWAKKIPIQFTGYNRSETLEDFPALVTLSTNLSGFSYAQFESDTNADLRFTDSTQTRYLNYEIEKWDTNGTSYVWVQVPQLTSGASIYAFWGKSGQTVPAYTTNGVTWSIAFALVQHYSQSSGSSVLDATAAGRGGTISNGYTWSSAGLAGGAVNLNSSTSFVCMASNKVPLSGPYTISAFFKGLVAPSNGWRTLTRGQTADHQVIVTNNGTVLGLYDNNNGAFRTTVPAYDLNPTSNEWHHLAAVGSGAQTLMYVDGLYRGTCDRKSTNDVYAIGNHWGGGQRWSDYLDEFRVCTIARSSNWVWACYMNQASNSLFGTYSAVVAGGSPVIRTDPATSVTTTSASLNGYLMSTGTSDTAIFVYYGPTDGGANAANWAYTNASLVAPQAVGTKSVSVSLPAGSEIYFRFAASNAAGVAWADSSQYLITTNVTVTATPAAVGESNELVRFAFARPAAFTNRALTVNFAITGGSASNGWDYTAGATSVSLPAGVAAATTTVATTMMDGLTEGDETIELTVTGVAATGGAPSPAIATITNTPIPVYTATANTLVLQQGVRVTLNGLPYDAYTNTVDTCIDASNPTVNYAASNIVSTCLDLGNNERKRGYLRFDNLGAYLPSNATVISAKLALTSAGDGANDMGGGICYRLATWNPAMTWNTAPADSDQYIGTFLYKNFTGGSWTAGAVKNVDVSAPAQGWAQGSLANHGLIFRSWRDGNGFAERNFYSSEEATVSRRPKLTIVYALTNQTVSPAGYEAFNPLNRKVVALSGTNIIQDTYVSGASGQTNVNYSTATYANLRTQNSDTVKRALLRIDTANGLLATFKKTSDPTNYLDKRLVSARLQISLAGQNWPGGAPTLRLCNQAWAPATATFNTRDGVNAWSQVWATGGDQNVGALIGTFPIQDTPLIGGAGTLDITSTLRSWIDGTAVNNGFVIGFTSYDYNYYVALTEYAATLLRPTLILEYYDIPVPGGFPEIYTDPPTGVTSAGANLNGTLATNGGLSTAVYVYYGPTDGAITATNWAFVDTSLAAPQDPGAKSVTLPLAPNSQYFYRFAASNSMGLVWASSSRYLITTNVVITAEPASIAETGVTGAFRFTRPAAFTNGALTVYFAIGGTASNGVDYSLITATNVTLAVGTASATLPITTIMDGYVESDETVILTELDGSYVLNAPAATTLTITNTPVPEWTAGTNTLVLQPGARVILNGLPYDAVYGDAVDTYIDQANPTTSYSNAVVIKACGQTNISQGATRGYLTFGNLQGYVPSNAVVISARLDLTGAGDGSGTEGGTFYVLTAPWSPAATWNSPPAGTGQIIGTVQRGEWGPWPSGAVRSIGLDSVVQAWHQGTLANYGLMFRCVEASTTYTERRFHSCEAATVSQRPKLTIAYALTSATVSPAGFERFVPMARKTVALSGAGSIQTTYINGDAGNSNYSTAQEVNLRTRFGQGVKRALVKINTTSGLLAGFAKSTAPTNHLDKRLIRARLRITASGGMNNSMAINLHLCTQSWDVATATFNTRDGSSAWSQTWATDSDQNVGAQVGAYELMSIKRAVWDEDTETLIGGSGAVDITTRLQAWINGTATNNGFVLGYTGADYDSMVALSPHAVPALRPTLIVEYYEVPPPPGTVFKFR
jgi:hypothetical protein